MRALYILLVVIFIGGCAGIAQVGLDQRFGPAEPRERDPLSAQDVAIEYRRIKPIMDNRCVVCHGCYDAPCQLKLGAFAGIDRGASRTEVYNQARLTAAGLTRLFEDAKDTAQWREKGFFPVLNEREQTPEANLDAGVMARILTLKHQHPLPDAPRLPKSLDVSLNRKQACPSIEHFERFAEKNPLWGMPYGLPALPAREYHSLMQWLEGGAPGRDEVRLSDVHKRHIAEWERFLNGDSLKQQLMSRYIYEHLFITHIHFDERLPRVYFRLVRSATPPGEPVERIATRRPYDDPGVEHVYYRLVPEVSTLLAKTFMPYAFNKKRMARYKRLFLDAPYTVSELPSYKVEVASNPFIAFRQIPADARYRFMLDEAQITIMGFIKGPVCRGQVALNVINDNFWVVFIDPDKVRLNNTSEFLDAQSKHLRLPAESQSNSTVLYAWLKYSNQQKAYLKAAERRATNILSGPERIDLDLIWDGDGENDNAALTVFRHFDSASVVKGFVGREPKTAWVIGYTLLERIHYLLVAGYDVYGNVGHQLNTRLYMDFLRMEGEANFLSLLPRAERERVRDYWYRGADKDVKDYIYGEHYFLNVESAIPYQTQNPKTELFHLLRQHLGPALNTGLDIHPLKDSESARRLDRLQDLKGGAIDRLPQTAFLTVRGEGGDEVYTLIRNNAHSNITSLFSEDKTRLPEEDTLTVVHGFVGASPNAFYSVRHSDLDGFIDALTALDGEPAYRAFLDRYAVRRTDRRFWPYSDELHRLYRERQPLEAALFDYNRLENR